MLIPLNWLREFVDPGLSAQQIADTLTMGGLEVDGVIERHAGLGRVVTAKVLSVSPHPNADKLRLAEVAFGPDKATIVCGAPNLNEGMYCALALPGSELPGGMKVGKAKIRGVESLGMLCSERELGISDDHSGIISLPGEPKTGKGLLEVLGLETEVLEIAITPNRGDALSVLGVARDLAAITGAPLTLPRIEFQEQGEPIDAQAAVDIEHPEGCPRYVARLVKGVTIAPSPLWMADRVSAAGMRPISNIVDITNYVLMELGQPLHAFDFHRLAGRRIVVRLAKDGERFTTLDGAERVLDSGMLLICDGEKPVALAGVMGGLNSEIADDTEDVLIESAFFAAGITRRTSKRLALSTEASYRFERGIDREGCPRAADRTAQLIAELGGGQIAPGAIDAHPLPYRAPELRLSVKRTARFLGLPLAKDQVVGPLRALGIEVSEQEDGDELLCRPPAARTDLERPVDLCEEVARLVGFDNIPARAPSGPLRSVARPWFQRVRAKARDLMAAQGFCEAISLSFAQPRWPQMMLLKADDPRREPVHLMNPLSEELSQLRTMLLPGLLAAARRNQAHRVAEVALFEVGRVFLPDPGQKLPQEPARLAAVLSGLAQPVSWWSGEAEVGLAHARGAVEYLLEGLGIPGAEFAPPDVPAPYLDAGTCLAVRLGGAEVGELGLIAAKVAEAFDLDRPAYGLELDFDALAQAAPRGKSFYHLPRFPEVLRDVALVVDEAVGAGELLAAARSPRDRKARRWLASVELFDLYRGKPLARGKKSLGLRFCYRDSERTLTEQEVLPAFEAQVDELRERFSAELRG